MSPREKGNLLCQVGFSLGSKGCCDKPGRCRNFCERSGVIAESDCNTQGEEAGVFEVSLSRQPSEGKGEQLI